MRIALLIIALLLLTACSDSVKFQCADGSFVDAQDKCPTVQPQIEEKIVYQDRVQTQEVIRYQCTNGTVVNELAQCNGTTTVENVNVSSYYMLESYDDYARYIKRGLQIMINESGLVSKSWRGEEGRDHMKKDGKVYLIMYEESGDKYRFWAVELNGETAAIVRQEEVTLANEIDYHALWWYDAGPRPATNATSTNETNSTS